MVSGRLSYSYRVDILVAILPSTGVLVLFVIAIRALVGADRRERAAQARWEAAATRPADAGDGAPAEPDQDGAA